MITTIKTPIKTPTTIHLQDNKTESLEVPKVSNGMTISIAVIIIIINTKSLSDNEDQDDVIFYDYDMAMVLIQQ